MILTKEIAGIAPRAINGRDKAGKPLLKQDVNPNRPDSPGQSPLFSHDARRGYDRVVKLLLYREHINLVRLNDKDREGLSCMLPLQGVESCRYC